MPPTKAEPARRRSSSTCRSGRSSRIIIVAAGRTGTPARRSCAAARAHRARTREAARAISSASRTMRVDQLRAARQVVDQPDHLAARHHARVAASPSTIDARSSIGAFAAITIWLHDELLAALHRDRLAQQVAASGVPEHALEAHRVARARAAGSRAACRRTSRSTNGVRSTRCGSPSTCVVTTVSVTRLREVDLLDRVGHRRIAREQEARAHRDADRAVGERRDEAAPVEEAARGDHRDVDRVDHLRQQHGGRHARRCARRPRRPARSRRPRPSSRPSRRGASRRSTGCRRAPASLSRFISSLARRQRERRDAHALLHHQLGALHRRRARRSAGSRRTGASVRSFVSAIASASWRRSIVADGDDPEPARVGGRGDELRAGHPAHAGLHDRELDADERRRARVRSAGWVMRRDASERDAAC